MRVAIYVALLVACIAVAPDTTRAAVASAAAVLFETLPYAAAAAILAPLLGRFAPTVVAYAGCGCGNGPGARSIPAAIACGALFGPYVALARWVGAIAVAALRRDGTVHEQAHGETLLHDLAQIAPAALLAGVLNVAAPALALAHRSIGLQVVIGAVLGFAGAPCALGGVALASALRAQSPIASCVILCIAGIGDLRVWWSPPALHVRGDRATYAMLAVACSVIAYGHGAALVHPRMTMPLWGCAVLSAYLAFRSRGCGSAAQRVVAGLLVTTSILGSPPPPPIATEATLDTLYPGERIEFTGVYETPHLVRYAITCCRADAHPVAIVLAHRLDARAGSWLSINGVVRRQGDTLVVDADRIERVAPPADPFVYL